MYKKLKVIHFFGASKICNNKEKKFFLFSRSQPLVTKMYVCISFHQQPLIQFSADTIYLEAEVSVPQDCPSFRMPFTASKS
jgi:hypothetical protein